jgi:hypothetical protein
VDDSDTGGFVDPKAALGDTLEELHDILLVVLEAAEMPEAKASMIEEWPTFTSAKDGLSHVEVDTEFDYCASPALIFVKRLIEALRMSVSKQISSEEAWTLARLEAMLEDTAGLVHRREKPPKDEQDLQAIMHDYLGACFPDFRKNPQIGGSIKNFIPDCGIASVGAAIEFKIAHTKEKAVVAFTGVVEDTGGYKGSKDWTRFYAVMYQAKPFILKSQLQSDMKRIKAATWKAILINGDTKPKRKKKKAQAKNLPVGEADRPLAISPKQPRISPCIRLFVQSFQRLILDAKPTRVRTSL